MFVCQRQSNRHVHRPLSACTGSVWHRDVLPVTGLRWQAAILSAADNAAAAFWLQWQQVCWPGVDGVDRRGDKQPNLSGAITLSDGTCGSWSNSILSEEGGVKKQSNLRPVKCGWIHRCGSMDSGSLNMLFNHPSYLFMHDHMITSLSPSTRKGIHLDRLSLCFTPRGNLESAGDLSMHVFGLSEYPENSHTHGSRAQVFLEVRWWCKPPTHHVTLCF